MSNYYFIENKQSGNVIDIEAPPPPPERFSTPIPRNRPEPKTSCGSL